MITIEAVCVAVRGLTPDELERWVASSWVTPDGAPGGYLFREIDVARVRMIHELRDDLRVNDEALPILLDLLDRLYEERRRLRRFRDALAAEAPEDVRAGVLRRLRED